MKDHTAKLKKLFEAAREQHAKTSEIIEEMGRVLNGEAGIGDKLRGIERDCSALWQGRYHSPYSWNRKQDVPAIKRLLKILEPGEIVTRYALYIRDNDKYYGEARHGFALFTAQVNRFASNDLGLSDLDDAPPSDCRHTPRCASDQAHTRKRSAELRA